MDRLIFFKTKYIFLTSFILLFSCTNPVAPEYKFVEGLIYIEGFVGTTEGSSYVNITTSDVAKYYRSIFVSGASVSFVNEDANQRIKLLESDFLYLPPTGFKGNIGEKWHLEVTLPNGNKYRSEIETINPSVPVTDISFRYDKELEYLEYYKGFVPGHEIAVTFDDPENQANYYYWRYKTYDKAKICKICYDGIFRNNNCLSAPSGGSYYFTYDCESDCWQIDYGNKFSLFSDNFSNGTTTTSLAVANVILTRRTKVLVELQQFSLTKNAYDYYRTIKDLIDNNGGFNAPLPAALIGNIYNPEDSNEFVLGRFTAASANITSIMIDRNTIEEFPVGPRIIPNRENPPSPYQTAPCEESRNRTAIKPEGWID